MEAGQRGQAEARARALRHALLVFRAPPDVNKLGRGAGAVEGWWWLVEVRVAAAVGAEGVKLAVVGGGRGAQGSCQAYTGQLRRPHSWSSGEREP